MSRIDETAEFIAVRVALLTVSICLRTAPAMSCATASKRRVIRLPNVTFYLMSAV